MRLATQNGSLSWMRWHRHLAAVTPYLKAKEEFFVLTDDRLHRILMGGTLRGVRDWQDYQKLVARFDAFRKGDARRQGASSAGPSQKIATRQARLSTEESRSWRPSWQGQRKNWSR